MSAPHSETEFDAIVVGSGPGGAAVARELSKARKRVLLLERGNSKPLKEGLLSMAPIVNVASVGENLATTRVFTTGGTTALYLGVAGPPSLEMFRKLGIDLSGQLAEAEKELPLNVVPDHLLGAQTTRVRDSAMQLGYPWKKNTMLVDLAKAPKGYAYEAKWTARSYVGDAVDAGATLTTGAKVLKVLTDGTKAVGVEYRLQKGKKDFEIRQAFGTRIVLAAGAMASALILRDSGIRSVAKSGFYCHPCFGVFGTIAGLGAADGFAGSMQAELDDDISCGDGNFPSTFYRMFMLGGRRFIRAWFHSRSVGVGVMVGDGLSGELRDDGQYHKALTEDEVKRLDKGAEIGLRIIRNTGAKNIFKSRITSAHVGGTIRIGEHLDETLQTEYTNLHVCDGSVIPAEFKEPPTLTLICLGKYLGQHLARSL